MPQGWEWLLLIAVVLLLFGAKKLPEMARSIGQSARVFKGEMKGMKADEDKTAQTPPPAEPVTPVLPPAQSDVSQAGNPSTSERSA